MGTPANQQQTFNQTYASDVNDFFPHGITVHVGDKVRFVPTGFHTVEFPAKGDGPAPLVAPTSKKIAGLNDAAGSPFWFNGQDEMNFNPVLIPGIYGKSVTHNGTKGIQSGLPLAPKPKPFTVKFKKAGKFTYYCNVHPGMTGTVRVKKRGARIPTAKQDRKALKKQISRDLTIVKALQKRTVPAGTVDVGEAGKHGVEYFGMLPGKLTVPVGTTLRFRMTPGSYEAHTATFGPGPIDSPSSYLGSIAKSYEGPQIDQRGLYPSDLPTAPATLSSSLHGNGFWNSGILDASNQTPLPDSNSVRFGAAGTYDYYCLIHPFMHGQIIVQ